MRYGGLDGAPGAEFDMRRRRSPLELAAEEAALRAEQNGGGGMPLVDHGGGQVALPPRAPAPVALAPQVATAPTAMPQVAAPPAAPPLGGLAQPHLQPASLGKLSVARRRRPQLGTPAMYRPRKPTLYGGVQAPAY